MGKIFRGPGGACQPLRARFLREPADARDEAVLVVVKAEKIAALRGALGAYDVGVDAFAKGDELHLGGGLPSARIVHLRDGAAGLGAQRCTPGELSRGSNRVGGAAKRGAAVVTKRHGTAVVGLDVASSKDPVIA